MDITWLGDNSFKINDGLIDVIINPSNETVDENTLTEDTVMLCTDLNNDYQTKLTKVDSPGEFEINNASIHGIANAIRTDDDRFTSAHAVMSMIVAGAVVSKHLEREQDEMERTP